MAPLTHSRTEIVNAIDARRTSVLDERMFAFETEDAFARVGAFGDARRRALAASAVECDVILDALAARKDHPTADQLYDDAATSLPHLTPSRVDHLLDELARIGKAAKLFPVGPVARFDARTDRHHHVVCTSCDQIVDIEALALSGLQFPSWRREGFDIHDYTVVIRGVCSRCLGERMTQEVLRQREVLRP